MNDAPRIYILVKLMDEHIWIEKVCMFNIKSCILFTCKANQNESTANMHTILTDFRTLIQEKVK